MNSLPADRVQPPAHASPMSCPRRRSSACAAGQETGSTSGWHENPTPPARSRCAAASIWSPVSAARAARRVTASTGNHGQSIAMACQREQGACTVFVPVGNNPEKNAAMRAFGARGVGTRPRLRRGARAMRERAGGTAALRALGQRAAAHRGRRDIRARDLRRPSGRRRHPRAIGGGSGACGCSLVRSALGLGARVIGVQAPAPDAFTRSCRGPARVVGERATFAEGMATRVTFDLTFEILQRGARRHRDARRRRAGGGVRLASRRRITWPKAPARPRSPPARCRLADQLAGKPVVAVMSGGNLDARSCNGSSPSVLARSLPRRHNRRRHLPVFVFVEKDGRRRVYRAPRCLEGLRCCWVLKQACGARLAPCPIAGRGRTACSGARGVGARRPRFCRERRRPSSAEGPTRRRGGWHTRRSHRQRFVLGRRAATCVAVM